MHETTTYYVSFFFFSVPLLAQDNLTLLLISGKEDTKTFLQDYLRPGTEGLIYNLSSGWYQTAEVKNPLGFEISVIANASVNLYFDTLMEKVPGTLNS